MREHPFFIKIPAPRLVVRMFFSIFTTIKS